MSVEEIIAEVKRLGPLDRRRVQVALNAAEAQRKPGHDVDQERRLAEVYERFETGWCHTGGRALSEGIDEALYGEDAGPMVG